MADVVGNDIERKKANENLLRCCSDCDVEGLERVLEEGKAHVECQNKSGDTGLIVASYYDNVACLQLLLDANADVNAQNHVGETGATWAAWNDCVESLKLLVDAKADVQIQPRDGYTALLRASIHGHVKSLKCLVAANADVHFRSKLGYTALNHVAEFGHMNCVKVLLLNNAEMRGRHGNDKILEECCMHVKVAKDERKRMMQFLFICCGAEGKEGRKEFAALKTRITEYHTELKRVLEKKVVVDTRLYLEENGLYHEPLERVMQYCGLELMLENDPNRDEADPIPELLRRRSERVRSAFCWGKKLISPLIEDETSDDEDY